MPNKSKNIFEIFKSSGMLFPTSPEEIEQFEKDNDIDGETPRNWNNPNDIVKNGLRELKNFNSKSEILNPELQNLAMAAREGKGIPDDIRKKMMQDKKDARQK